MFTDILFSNKLTKNNLNFIFNLAESLVDDQFHDLSTLNKDHPVSQMYMNLSKGISRDLDSEFEYSMIAELINNSIFNESEYNIRSRFIKELSIYNDNNHLGINIGKLSKYLL